jgi:hypothetical protein
MTPVNIGERDSPARMMSWVRSVVRAMWQLTWRGCSAASTEVGETPAPARRRAAPRAGRSRCCVARDARRRAGLEPLDHVKGISRSRSASAMDGGSPARPPR